MMPSEKASSFPMFSGEGACDNIAANVAHAMSKTEWAPKGCSLFLRVFINVINSHRQIARVYSFKE